MKNGTVKWLNEAKGFGFIQPEGQGKDVHFSLALCPGVTAGTPVHYEASETDSGFEASTVTSAE